MSNDHISSTNKVHDSAGMNEHKKPTLLVMAGGTGGHIFPGLAVADKLQAQGWHIHWLGTAEKMEAELVPKHGYEISFIDISGLRNKQLITWIKLPFKLLKSLNQARKVIKKVRPDVVLGMGGYASAPGGFMAWLMKIPLIVHEQNAAAGLSNRLLSKVATTVCCAFPNAFNSNINAHVVGNPIRESISVNKKSENIHKVKEDEDNEHNILIVGGSLGAQVLNEVMPKSFLSLKEMAPQNSIKQIFNIIHQTGKGKYKKVLATYNELELTTDQVKVSEFIDDIASAYEWADIVICRAGALTVSELAMAGKPAIFIPLPHAVDDHQTKNANYLVSRGAATLLPQKELTEEKLTALLTSLFSDAQILKTMSESAIKAANIDATNDVADLIKALQKPRAE
jgi:UDP-N-acetylglucosamine--N-acetylmuramyl-(pentapeptide) pyrophosphoryl-undecaprenol N-acetylglucosamine transferase